MTELHNVGTELDDFDTAWYEALHQHQDLLAVIIAAIRDTEGGDHPIKLAQLAETVGQPIERTTQLLDQGNDGSPWVQTRRAGDAVTVDLSTAETPRFTYQIGDRRIDVAGCAPDAFLAAHALDRPMLLESTCPVTGTKITVEFSATRAMTIDPGAAVVTTIHPGNATQAMELTDADRVDADICQLGRLYASAEVARPWLDHNPGGRIIPVAAFDRWWRDLCARAIPRL